jgi:hypothetical protein
MDIEKELQKFSITDSAISELNEKYMPLIISDLSDSKQLKVISDARKVVKKYRVEVDHKRKELTADALAFQKAINTEAKRITGMLEPIEDHLESQEKRVEDEKQRILKEIQDLEAKIFQQRITGLIDSGFSFNGMCYVNSKNDILSNDAIKNMSDEEYSKTYLQQREYFIQENIRKREEEEARKLEEKRLHEERVIQEAARQEKMKLEEEARKIEEQKLYEERMRLMKIEEEQKIIALKIEEEKKAIFEEHAVIKRQRDEQERSETLAKKDQEIEKTSAAVEADIEEGAPIDMVSKNVINNEIYHNRTFTIDREIKMTTTIVCPHCSYQFNI